MFSTQKRLQTKDVVSFCHQVRRLLKQGINLRTALLIFRDFEQKRWGERIGVVVSNLDEGIAFGQALKRAGFPGLLTSFVMAGEQHNGLIHALEKCELYYKRKMTVQQKMMKALIYPLTVLLLMGCAFIILQTTVLPRFASLYETIGVALPWYTRLLLTINTVWLKLLLLIVVLLIPGVIFFVHSKRHKLFAVRLFQFSLRVPFVREIVKLRLTSVFSWQLGLQLQAGIPLIRAFEMIMRNWPWDESKRVIYRIEERLKKGFSFEASISPEAGKYFLTYLPRQLALGESSGLVAEALIYSGEMADERFAERIEWLLRVWEPFLILLLGVLLAAIVLALFVPMVSLVNGL